MTKLPSSLLTSLSEWPSSPSEEEEAGGVSNVADAETQREESYHDTGRGSTILGLLGTLDRGRVEVELQRY